MGTRIHSNRELVADQNGTVALDDEGTLYRVVKPSLPGFRSQLIKVTKNGSIITIPVSELNMEFQYVPPLQRLEPVPF